MSLLAMKIMLGILGSVQPAVQQADHVIISKSHHTLTLSARGQPIHTYAVALGRAAGVKQFQGDHKTPEGHYFVDGHKPDSRFHRALHLSYPDPADRARAVVAHRNPGGDIEIHGLPPGLSLAGYLQHLVDWTDGCVALSNREIDEVYAAVADGTPVDIEP